MTVEQLLLERAKADADVIAIAGNRGYGTRFPENVSYPAFLVVNVTTPRDSHLRGPNNTRRAQVQFDCVTQEGAVQNYDTVVKSLAAAIIAAITPEPFTDGSPATMKVAGIPSIDERDAYDPDDRRVLHRYVDCVVWYREMN